MLSIGGGGIICSFIPNFSYFPDWGDEARPLFFSRKQIKWRWKKGLHRKLKFLCPKSSEDQKKVQSSSSTQTQTIVKLLGGMRLTESNLKPPRGVGWKYKRIEAMATSRWSWARLRSAGISNQAIAPAKAWYCEVLPSNISTPDS